MLTPLQQQIRSVLAHVAGDADLALAGAAALVVSDVVDRPHPGPDPSGLDV